MSDRQINTDEVCDVCEGTGLFICENGAGYYAIERCDQCGKFRDDTEAFEEVHRIIYGPDTPTPIIP